MTDDHDPTAGGPFRPRPTWWVEGQARDADDAAADMKAGERDERAGDRDRDAAARDQAALRREQDAADFAGQAHERYDRHAEDELEPLLNAASVDADEQAHERIRESLQKQPELAAAFERALRHVDELYVSLLRAGSLRDNARSDLATLVQLLAAAATDRRAAERDREGAHTDRADARRDRDNARSGRQQSAIDRARDHDYD
jgi:hypothetical protein